MRFPRLIPGKVDNGQIAHISAQQELSSPEPEGVAALASTIDRAGMSGVALFALDVLKPLHWLGGQALWILQPFVESFSILSRRKRAGDSPSVGSVARLLEKEGGLDELEARLESLRRGGV